MTDSGSSDNGGVDPYDPDRPTRPDSSPPPPPPQAPQSEPGGWGGGMLGGYQSGSTPAGEFGQPDQPAQPGPPVYGQAGAYGQPGQPAYGQPPGTPPPNYLVPAILSTIFCCLPLGIASIVFAAQVNGKYQVGDLAGAQESSSKAKKFAIWSAVAGAVVLAIYIVFAVVAVMSGVSTSP